MRRRPAVTNKQVLGDGLSSRGMFQGAGHDRNDMKAAGIDDDTYLVGLIEAAGDAGRITTSAAVCAR